ncbi:hypothetical protein F7R91_37660 [Streptomyces luteolifulvus]|uniref:Uncharacterized protein n=1 Tax=Streptomyces luteolifulvus TaxID=2615112 RepID=A0A6H9UPS5_9ACTN|nr:hypothetical protein [Streptomyces luteolifulvus]KAB1140007.1 hypothetical protein F7R91_37660 [Streptomyces luteolifulvus]
MVGPQRDTQPASERLVVIDASVRTARSAHTLGCHTVFVQRPGAPVHELVDDFSGYYNVDFTGETFEGFVLEVLRPLAPTAVVSLSDDGVLPAALANSLLGTPGTQADVLRRLTAGAVSGEADGTGEWSAYTFSEAGAHRWVALLDEGTQPTLLEHVVPERRLTSGEYDAVEAALTGFLDAAGLENGPARIRLRSRDGEVRVLGAAPTAGTDEEAELVRRLTGFDLVRASLGRALEIADDATSPARAQEGATR